MATAIGGCMGGHKAMQELIDELNDVDSVADIDPASLRPGWISE